MLIANKAEINSKRRKKCKVQTKAKKDTSNLSHNFETKSAFHNLDLNKSMQKFHSSLEIKIVHCNICYEAWPLSISPKSLKGS